MQEALLSRLGHFLLPDFRSFYKSNSLTVVKAGHTQLEKQSQKQFEHMEPQPASPAVPRWQQNDHRWRDGIPGFSHLFLYTQQFLC